MWFVIKTFSSNGILESINNCSNFATYGVISRRSSEHCRIDDALPALLMLCTATFIS